jgi:hypothetical protein
MQQEWNIKSRSAVCVATGRPFVDGEIFHTALFHTAEGFQRQDLSEEAWTIRSADPTAERPFSSWRSKFEPPAPPPKETLRRDDAEGMLRRLVEENDPAHTNARYLLAVMLERKRVLRPQPSAESGTLIYERVGTGETFIISDPDLSLSDLEKVQIEVSALLTGLAEPLPSTTRDPAASVDQGATASGSSPEEPGSVESA